MKINKKSINSINKKILNLEKEKDYDDNLLVKAENLWLYFQIGTQFNPKYKLILRNVNLDLYKGDVLGIIGESGSGKTVLTNTFTGLNSDTQLISSGKIIIDGYDVTQLKETDWEFSGLRGRFISQVFQNPLSTLNPTQKISTQIIESMKINNLLEEGDDGFEKALSFLKKVKINNAVEVMNMFPHQLSGGMMQRIVIVAILACNPRVIIFDEPTTALDPSVQREIIDLINDIKDEFDISIIFISHDIGLVSSIASRIAIMYAGKIIEEGLTREILNDPKHPYTWGLLSSMPEVSEGKELYSIPGSVPTSLLKINGDAFSPRSDYELKIDSYLSPPRYKVTKTHFVYSWLYDSSAHKFEKPETIKRLEKKAINHRTKSKNSKEAK